MRQNKLLRPGNYRDEIMKLLVEEEPAMPAAAVLVLVGTVTRLLEKYGDRGYRLLLLETGHLSQNILLVAESLHLAAVPVGGFQDDELNGRLGLDRRREWALYPILLAAQ